MTPNNDLLAYYSPWVGTPTEAHRRIDKVKSKRVLLVAIKSSNAKQEGTLAQTLAQLVPLILEADRAQDDKTLRALVDALVPRKPPEPTLLLEARMTARAQTAVLEDGNWVTASEWAKVAGLSDTNPSAQPNKWKRQGLIFAIHHAGVDYFPGYAMDPDAGWRPRKALKEILAVFAGKKDGWRLAYWFHSANSFLGGQRPQDLLATQPDRVRAAAEDEMVGVVHG